MPLQRDVEDGGHRKTPPLTIDQRGVATDDAAVLERTHPAPAGRGGHADLVGDLLIGGAAILLQMGEYSRVLFFDHGNLSNRKDLPNLIVLRKTLPDSWSTR